MKRVVRKRQKTKDKKQTSAVFFFLLALPSALASAGTENRTAQEVLALQQSRMSGLLAADYQDLKIIPDKPKFNEPMISPTNVGTFLSALSISEGIDSFVEGNPMIAERNLHTWAVPMTYIAFGIFDAGRYLTARNLYRFTTNPHLIQSRSQLNFMDKSIGLWSLAGGSFLLHQLMEVYHSKQMRQILGEELSVGRKYDLFKEMFDELYTDPKLWADRALQLGSLSAAALTSGYLTQVERAAIEKVKTRLLKHLTTIPLEQGGLKITTKMVNGQLVVASAMTKNGVVTRAAQKLVGQPVTLGKVILKLKPVAVAGKHLTKVSKVLKVALHLGDLVVFIKLDTIYANLLRPTYWTWYHANEINEAEEEIFEAAQNAIVDGKNASKHLRDFKVALDKLNDAFNQYRLLKLMDVYMEYFTWLDKLISIDRELYKRVSYYSWFASGGDINDSFFTSNPKEWHLPAGSPQFTQEYSQHYTQFVNGFNDVAFVDLTFYKKLFRNKRIPSVLSYLESPIQSHRKKDLRALVELNNRTRHASKENKIAAVNAWVTDYTQSFEKHRTKYIESYNEIINKKLEEVFTAEGYSIASGYQLPNNPATTFDDQLAVLTDLFAHLSDGYPLRDQVTGAMSKSIEPYFDLPNGLDGRSHEERQEIAANFTQSMREVRKAFQADKSHNLKTRTGRQRTVMQELIRSVESTMLYKFSMIDLHYYLLNKNKQYLDQRKSKP